MVDGHALKPHPRATADRMSQRARYSTAAYIRSRALSCRGTGCKVHHAHRANVLSVLQGWSATSVDLFGPAARRAFSAWATAEVTSLFPPAIKSAGVRQSGRTDANPRRATARGRVGGSTDRLRVQHADKPLGAAAFSRLSQRSGVLSRMQARSPQLPSECRPSATLQCSAVDGPASRARTPPCVASPPRAARACRPAPSAARPDA